MLVGGNHDLRQEARIISPGVVVRHQPVAMWPGKRTGMGMGISEFMGTPSGWAGWQDTPLFWPHLPPTTHPQPHT